ncbi:transposase [Kribbella sp. NBC_00359]
MTDIRGRELALGKDVHHGVDGQEEAQPRRSFTPEFKVEIVELCQRGDRSVGQVAKDLGLTETAVREWLRQAERDAGICDGGLTSSEKDELAQLRRENRRLRKDVEILKRGGCPSKLEATQAGSPSAGGS